MYVYIYNIHVYICIYSYINIYIHIYLYIHMYLYIHTQTHTHTCIRIFKHVFVYVHTYVDRRSKRLHSKTSEWSRFLIIYIYSHAHTHTFAHIHVHIWIYMYIYIFVCVCMHVGRRMKRTNSETSGWSRCLMPYSTWARLSRHSSACTRSFPSSRNSWRRALAKAARSGSPSRCTHILTPHSSFFNALLSCSKTLYSSYSNTPFIIL